MNEILDWNGKVKKTGLTGKVVDKPETLRDYPRLITCKTPVDRNADRLSAINL